MMDGFPIMDLEELEAKAQVLQERNRERMRITRARSDMRSHMVYRWTHRGLLCGIAPSPGYGFNGYVRMPRELYQHTDHYDSVPVEIHGGLTYGPDHGRWIGFDTAHCWDHWPWRTVSSHIETFDFRRRHRARLMYESLGRITPGTERMTIRWSIPRLRLEVNNLAEQIRALSQGRPALAE